MLKERQEALGEFHTFINIDVFHTIKLMCVYVFVCPDEADETDELENAITSTTECLQYDHPNHTVTVTTISDLDLSGSRLLESQKVKARQSKRVESHCSV